MCTVNMAGVFGCQVDLLPRSFHHASRDLAVLHIENEPTAAGMLQGWDVDAINLNPKSKAFEDSKEDLLLFNGHKIDDSMKPLPHCVQVGRIPVLFSSCYIISCHSVSVVLLFSI